MNLPAPVEQAPASANGPEGAASSEKAPQSGANQAVPAAMPTSIPLPTPPVMPAAPASTSLTSSNPLQASDDSDLIEKEWVTKAKEIVARTREDPHKQSDELNVFKADYMKKRYNRTVKLK